jgi:hypothetical protein
MRSIRVATIAHGLSAGTVSALLAIGTTALVSGCASTAASDAPASSGAAGGSTSVGAADSLKTCAETVGTVRLQDAQASSDTNSRATGDSALESLRLLLRDVNDYQQKGNDKGGVSIDSLRLLIQQSNCLAIVERGIGERAANDEKGRARSPSREVRDDANMGEGQEVAADFVLRSTVVAINNNESSSGVSLGGFVPWKALGSLGANKSSSSADVQLVLVDVRSKLQLAVAQGHGSGDNTGLATNLLSRVSGGLGSVKVGTQSNTSTAKILLQAYADAYNKLVPALLNYKTQTVKGGLGTGGTLRVQGKQP